MADPQSANPEPMDATAFKRELTATIPHLRAFARGLCGRSDLADDLVQEALMRAWAARDRFTPGTSMRAWTFTILRNIYLTEMRRNRFAAITTTPPPSASSSPPPGRRHRCIWPTCIARC